MIGRVPIYPSAYLPQIFAGHRFHWGFFLALLVETAKIAQLEYAKYLKDYQVIEILDPSKKKLEIKKFRFLETF